MTPSGGNPRPGNDTQVLTPKESGLGTFEGVFTPSILTILGVIMYLRLGWVVGNVGLGRTLLIVTLSTSITFLTALSISAIATDQRIRTGGAYYMISRSLGIEAGGAVGIPLFLAQALSVALYTVGFAESIVSVFPWLDQRAVGLFVTAAVALLAILSTRAALRAQYLIMGAIGLSLLSLLVGRSLEPFTATLPPIDPLPIETDFWRVFAVFFPAVTGIMAGVNLSGDLRDPGRSIPRGTFAAIGTGFLIYLGVPIVLASRVDQGTLVSDPLVMRRIAFWGDAVLLGIWGATLSSAVGSILGAPRVLQALARDRVLPRGLRWLGRGSGAEDAPRIGTAFTMGLALAAVWLGNLNVIAPVLTMFFLTTYGVLNVAAGIERFVQSPSFRPTFRVHWSLSLLGALACVGVMLVINPVATVVAIVFTLGVFLWLERRELTVAWGDVRHGLWLAVTRSGLMRVRPAADPKNWRPHLLVLSGSPTRRWHLIDLATALTHNRALMTISTIVPSRTFTVERRQKLEASMREYLGRRGVEALVRVIPASNPFLGAERMMDMYGLGALVPNTVLLGDTREPAHLERYARMIRVFNSARRNVLIVRDEARDGFGARKRIDVWWRGLKGNGGLMMILAYLLQSSLRWRGVEVRIKMAVPNEAAARGAEENLASLVERIRTGARHEVLVSSGRSFESILRESSGDADLVMLGMAQPGEDFATYLDALRHRTYGLPTTMFVLAAEEIGYGEVLQ